MTTSESRETPPQIGHFDPGKAIRRLLAGEPPQYIFGDDISLLTIEDLGAVLNKNRPEARKVRFTLATAALMDAAQIVTGMPEENPASKLTHVSIDTITPQVLQQSTPFLERTFEETREAVRNATDSSRKDSTLSKALTMIRRYLPIFDEKKAHLEIKELADRQHRTIEGFLPDYYQLLSSVYQNNFGTYPPFSAFRNMAENSIGILGRIAAQGFGYLIVSNGSLKRQDVVGKPFDSEKFELFQWSGGKLVLLLKVAARDAVNTAYKSLPGIDTSAMINCPANVVGANNDDQPRTSHSFIEAVNLRALSHLKSAS